MNEMPNRPTPSPEKQLRAKAEERNAASMQVAGASLNGLPKEPIPPDAFNVLAEAANKALDELSGGQVDVVVPTITEPIESYDDATGLAINALKAAFDQTPEGKPYAFELDALATPGGVQELAANLYDACQDPKLVRALSKPTGAPAPAEPVEKKPGREAYLSKMS